MFGPQDGPLRGAGMIYYRVCSKRGLSFQAHADDKKMARLAVSGNEEETGS